MTSPVRILAPRPTPVLPALDAVQRCVVAHGRDQGHLLVVGAPGSGKTTAAMAVLEHRIEQASRGSDVLMLVPTRRAAARVRDEVTARLGRTVGEVLVRTPASIAFSILRTRAALLGRPAPMLVTGPEQDAILAELLAGHREGAGRAPQWPAHVPQAARALRAFRDELRDVLMRAAEAGLSPAALAALARRRGREEWVAAAAVLREYEQVLQLGQLTPDRGERFDAALIVDEAVEALRSWSQVLPGSDPPRFTTVVVDDHQDSTLATARLLRAFTAQGAQLFLFGDADVAVQGFRGGAPALVAAATAGEGHPGGFAAANLTLPTVWRHPPALRRATAAVTECLAATGGVGHRLAESAADDPAVPPTHAPAGVATAVLRTRAQEAAHIARVMREEHLHHGTDYADMAVVVRGGAEARALRRRLAAAGVPVAVAPGETALRDAPAVAPLLVAVGAALGEPLEVDGAVALLTSPLAGSDRLDAVSLRALRRALRAQATVAGPHAASDELLVDVLSDGSGCAALPPRVRRGPARIAGTIEAARRAAAVPGATAEQVVWASWAAADVAESWRRAALAGGPAGDRADRDLDGVLELFRAAEQFSERNPAAGPREFLRDLQRQDVPSDTLAVRAGREHAVEVVTAAGAAGRQWSVVAVAGVQEEAWPDLRVRDSLLGAQDLADVASGRGAAGRPDGRQARHDVLQDELRSFAVAVSRARRRLLVTAVRDGDLAPSAFLDLVDPEPEGRAERPLSAAAAPLDLRGTVGALRAELPDGADAAAAAELLATLAAHGVSGADPAQWPQVLPESTQEQLWGSEDVVELSPSSLETATRCALRWALERVGGRRAPGTEQNLGTLVHAIAAEHPYGTLAELQAALDRRWPELGLSDNWLGRRQRHLAEQMIERLAGYLATRPGPVEVERTIEATVGRVKVRGRVDRLEHLDDGAIRVVDLKTGSSAKSAADAATDPQLAAYQAAVRRGALGEGAAAGGAALVYVGVGTRLAAERHQGAEDGWAEEVLDGIARTASASSFTATVGEWCRSCPVASSCPARPEGERVAR